MAAAARSEGAIPVLLLVVHPKGVVLAGAGWKRGAARRDASASASWVAARSEGGWKGAHIGGATGDGRAPSDTPVGTTRRATRARRPKAARMRAPGALPDRSGAAPPSLAPFSISIMDTPSSPRARIVSGGIDLGRRYDEGTSARGPGSARIPAAAPTSWALPGPLSVAGSLSAGLVSTALPRRPPAEGARPVTGRAERGTAGHPAPRDPGGTRSYAAPFSERAGSLSTPLRDPGARWPRETRIRSAWRTGGPPAAEEVLPVAGRRRRPDRAGRSGRGRVGVPRAPAAFAFDRRAPLWLRRHREQLRASGPPRPRHDRGSAAPHGPVRSGRRDPG